MPFTFDFNTSIEGTHQIEVSPKGWKGPLTIEYCVAQAHKYDTMLSVVWRIKGTSHCFTIDERRLNVLTHGKYKNHFELALENFREDYLSWFKEPEYEKAEWKYEYQRQFGNLIEPGEDNGSEV